ncbi:MAG: dTMP kinase [Bacteroidales bacterium]|jgi:dTMP kinase|nr:dTMP kinase [Bacteroidales bacterium]MCK9498020.1 dTMP kinase [Bacteroidales bacterium]NLB86208.1 dTMP kinase [Bacteroidales bacterium]
MAFIVIEGLDGAGKSTQVELLKEYFKNINKKTEFIHFPTTDSPIYGDLISKFLRGEFGGIKDVNPYLVALLFAGDRHNLKSKIKAWLDAGKIVINDRYVYSNIGFQCAKMQNQKQADELFDWIFNLEFNYFNIPKPDLSIFLDVPFSFTKNKLKQAREGKDREYLKGKIDIHEEDLNFQKLVRETYLKAIEKDENLIRIDCADKKEQILSPNCISKLIIKEIEKRFTFY